MTPELAGLLRARMHGVREMLVAAIAAAGARIEAAGVFRVQA